MKLKTQQILFYFFRHRRIETTSKNCNKWICIHRTYCALIPINFVPSSFRLTSDFRYIKLVMFSALGDLWKRQNRFSDSSDWNNLHKWTNVMQYDMLMFMHIITINTGKYSGNANLSEDWKNFLESTAYVHCTFKYVMYDTANARRPWFCVKFQLLISKK